MILYRATNRKADAKKVPVDSCWTPEKNTAIAYTDNPGFGGRHIVSIEIAESDLEIADWTDELGGLRAMVRDLLGESAYADEVLGDWSGYCVFHVLENNAVIRDLAREKYDWVVYTDDYPEGATTYRKMR